MHATSLKVPSSSLLRYLRIQAENVCFLMSTDGTYSQATKSPTHQRPLSRHTCIRPFGTVPRHDAVVEPSMLHVDFRRQRSNQDPLLQPYQPSKIRPGLIVTCRTQGGSRTPRYASTDARPLLQRLWQLKGRRAETALKPNGLPPLPGFLDDAGGTILGRSAGKASNDLKLRCTEFDENGNVTLVNGEFKKAELIAKVKICSF